MVMLRKTTKTHFLPLLKKKNPKIKMRKKFQKYTEIYL